MARGTVYNPTVTKDKMDLVNEENIELLNEFIEYLQSTDKAEGTIKNYTSDIKIAYIWSLEKCKNKSFIEFTKRDIMKYQNYMLNSMGLSSNRIRRLKASLSSLSNFIENVLDDDYPEFRNIVNKIPAPIKEAVRQKTVLSDEQVQTCLDALIASNKIQMACVLALAWSSGARKSELLRFKISDFKEENIKFGSLYKTTDKMKTKGRGSKGKLLYRYCLKNKIKPYLDLWIEERNKLEDIPEELQDLIFIVKRKGIYEEAQVSTLDSWSNFIAKKLNVDFYFHCLRHNFTTELSKSGIPANVIKDIIGWSDLSMVFHRTSHRIK